MKARIVFDLDGTLIDSAPDIRAMANTVLADLGLRPLSLAETRAFVGKGIHTFVAEMRASRGIPDVEQDRLAGDMIALYDDAVTLTTPYPGVVAALDQLAAHHTLGICTNKPVGPTRAVLRHLKLDRYFSAVSGGDNPLGRKPDPAPLLAVLAELGTGPCVFVGDSEVDAETARRAGVPFFLFTEGYRRAPVDALTHDVAFENFADMPGRLSDFLAL